MTTRRGFMRAAAASGALAYLPGALAAEPPPETKTIRIPTVHNVCWAPAYVSEELLKAEGFSDVRLVHHSNTAKPYESLAAGEIDVLMGFVAPTIQQIDAGNPLVILGGVHPGCLELFATPEVRSVQDLKGKLIATAAQNSPGQLFTAAFLGHVGIDPKRDVRWTFQPPSEQASLLAARKIDAFMVSPPDSEEARAKKIGHVVVNTTTDRPWSQYFCCMMSANRDFLRKHPIATKRAMRAILKASHVCASDPEAVARHLVKRGFTKNYEYTITGLRSIPYGRWRDYDAEDTVRYYALRLKEAGFIKTSPKKLIAEGTDWRFLNELKKEMKT